MNKVLYNLIAKEGGCFRCALRLSGETNISSYSGPELDSIANSLGAQADFTDCTICLGVLNPSPMLPKVVKAVKDFECEYSDYKFQVTLPPILYLRQEWIYGKCKLSGIQLGRIIEIKDVFKWIFSPKLGDHIGKSFSIDSDFKINIEFICNDSDLEIKEFYQYFKSDRNKESFQSTLRSINIERLIACFPVLKPYNIDINVACSHGQVYLYGNYLKLSRKISQTPWNQDSDNEIEDSVQEALSRVMKPAFKGSSGILHSSVI
jgi:tRNA U54 and U55 pseudouridine synthase Pus10